MNSVNFDKENDLFIKLFKELEETIKVECEINKISFNSNDNISYLINKLSEKNKIIKNHKRELDLIREVRNLNTHTNSNSYRYTICPNPEINIILQNIINEIKNPPMILDSNICIKKSSMYCKSLNDSVYETIIEMSNKTYTHIPIIEDNKLVGVFSENTLFDMVKRDEIISIDKNTKFNEIIENLKIENHSLESFEFISRTKTIYDVEDIFKKYFSNSKRIGCIYITQNGKTTENILGMVTAWDVLGN